MRTDLAVSFEEKDNAKALGAKWDGELKVWFAPYSEDHLIKKWGINYEPLTALIGEDRTYGGNSLFIDMIPSTCWFTNARSCVMGSEWDRLRRFVYDRVKNKCECCGEVTSSPEAHERWEYNEDTYTQIMRRLVCLCTACHETTHIGLAGIKGRYTEAMEHLKNVTCMTDSEAELHDRQSKSLWQMRSKHDWNLDLSILSNSGIKVKAIPSPDERNTASMLKTSSVNTIIFPQGS